MAETKKFQSSVQTNFQNQLNNLQNKNTFLNRNIKQTTLSNPPKTSTVSNNTNNTITNNTAKNTWTTTIEQPRDNTTKTNNLFQVWRVTTNTMNRPREQTAPTSSQNTDTLSSTGNYSEQESSINNGNNNQTLWQRVKTLKNRFNNTTSSDGIDYKAKYEELINNPDVLCRPDGTPLPIEQQPPQVQEKMGKTVKSIKNVTNPNPTPQLQPEQTVEQEQTVEEQPTEEPIVQQEQVQEEETEKPEMNLWENKEGLIYGRASGEAQQTINTNANEYNPEIAINQERQVSYQNLQGMSSYNIAVSMANGYTPFGEQAMRDLQQYDPQKYQQIQDELKKIQVGEQINQIASGGKIDITSQTRAMTDTINNSIDDWAKNNSDSQSYDGTLNLLTSKLASSQTAQSATQEMLNINKDIAEIQTQMNNLPKEAQKAFKGDVPQYLVDAYISNKAQELTTKLNTLQTRYAGLSDMYKAELSQKQFEAEMELKQQQMVIQQNQRALEQQFKMGQQNWENNFKANQFNRQVGQQDWENAYKTNQFNRQVDQQNRENAYKTNQFNWQVGQQDRENQYKLKQYDLDISQLRLSSMKMDSNGRVFQINSDGTYTYLSDNTAKTIMNQQIDTAINSLMQKCPQGANWWQCEAVTDEFNRSTYWQEMLPRDKDWKPSKELWRTYTTAEEKKSYVNTPYIMKWATAVFNYTAQDGVSKDAQIYWHTALIVGIDEKNGTVTYLDGNRKGDEKIMYTTMKIEDFYKKTGLQGFRYPPYDKKLDTIQTNDITAQNTVSWFDESLTSLYGKVNGGKSLTSEEWKTVDQIGISRADFMKQATNYKNYQIEQMSPQAESLIKTLQEVKDWMGRFDALTASYGEEWIWGTEWAYYRALLNKANAQSVLQNFLDLKSQGATFGTLTDSEWKIIGDSASILWNFNMPYDKYMKAVDDTIRILQKWIDSSKKTNSWNKEERVNFRA